MIMNKFRQFDFRVYNFIKHFIPKNEKIDTKDYEETMQKHREEIHKKLEKQGKELFEKDL